MGTGCEGIDPFLSAGFGDVFGDLLVQEVNVGMGRVVRAEGVTLGDESFGRVREVGDVVLDVALGDVMFGGSLEDEAELGLSGATGGGQVQTGKSLLGLTGEGFPVRFVEVDVGDAGWGWWVGLEVAFQEEENGKVI